MLVFNRLSEMGALPIYGIGSRVGLGGIRESLLLFGLMGAIGVRFAGKYVNTERYSLQLKQVNEDNCTSSTARPKKSKAPTNGSGNLSDRRTSLSRP